MSIKKIPGTLKRVLKKVHLTDDSRYDMVEWDKKHPPQDADIETANVATSQFYGVWSDRPVLGQHAPVIDLDIPHTYVPSTTEGHGHLYIDHPMSTEHYFKLLSVLHEVGILETGSYRGAVNRGWSAVRLPWVKKVCELTPNPDPDPDDPRTHISRYVQGDTP